MTTDKERIATLLTALEAALDIAQELTDYVYPSPNSTIQELRDLQKFAKFEREKESEEK